MDSSARAPIAASSHGKPGAAAHQHHHHHDTLPWWLAAPALAVLATLLLTCLYVIRLEQAQSMDQVLTIRELRSQLVALQREAHATPVVEQCSASSVVSKMQEDLHKLERSTDTLRASKDRTEKELEEMAARVSLLQNEHDKLKVALKAVKAEIAQAGGDAGGGDGAQDGGGNGTATGAGAGARKGGWGSAVKKGFTIT